MHLALVGTASAIDLQVRVGERTSVPAPTVPEAVVARARGVPPVSTPLPAGGGAVRAVLPERDPGQVVRVYLPEAVEVQVDSIAAADGEIVPAPQAPLLVAYGDSITQGWSVSEPGLAWPSLVGEVLGLDVVNLGFAGAARGELLAADAVAGSGAAVVAIAWGTNAWSSLPTDEALIAEQMRVFLTAVRQGLPLAPVVVVSPIVRPEAEQTPNRFGTTHATLRAALEAAVSRFVSTTGDERITLVPGLGLVSPDQLADGIHPGDAGHAAIALGLVPHVAAGLELAAMSSPVG
ncbi:SGNH/GDSL hydrolase family protein [Nonomuraea sp. NPDC005650]|uniref:SGNH/GDSL hydrolase family protein n=1 Tax=Nonomuraea sp. NPDC005650 TaxID=3157045 RepID=UPI0033AA23EA